MYTDRHCCFYLLNLLILLVSSINLIYCDVKDLDVITDLYNNYRDLVGNDNKPHSFRRVLKNNKEYELHVQKLKEVKGFNRHNVVIKEKTSDNNPLIYINNPVETKLFNSYLTAEQFKNILIERSINEREETVKMKNKIIHKTTKSHTIETNTHVGDINNKTTKKTHHVKANFTIKNVTDSIKRKEIKTTKEHSRTTNVIKRTTIKTKTNAKTKLYNETSKVLITDMPLKPITKELLTSTHRIETTIENIPSTIKIQYEETNTQSTDSIIDENITESTDLITDFTSNLDGEKDSVVDENVTEIELITDEVTTTKSQRTRLSRPRVFMEPYR